MVEPRRPNQAPRPTASVRRPGEPEHVPVPPPEGFEVRDGDVLVVAYPEVTLPLKVQYAMLRVGGMSYTRQLRAGDDVAEQFDRISRWLSAAVEGDIRRKAAAYMAELEAVGKR